MAAHDTGGDSPSEQAAVDPVKDLTAYLQHLQTRLQPLTKSAAQLPGPSDLSFHRSLDRQFGKDLEDAKSEILSTLNGLIRFTDDGKARKELGDKDVIEPTKFERNLSEVIDDMLERTNMRLDEYAGKVSVQSSRRRAPQASSSSVPASGPLPGYILNAPIKPLPQERFNQKPDNSRDRHWTHSLQHKPNSLVPLSWKASSPDANGEERIVGQRRGMYCAEGDPLENPYYYEIGQFKAPAHALSIPQMDQLVAPPPLLKEEPDAGPIPYTWVADKGTFDALCRHLSEERVKEIAVDVEHHNFRSYQGLVCLVQISTRWQDFIIDALQPSIRDMAYMLNESFTDPAKVKILHGAEHDILWLQRDLGVYVVGLFDTYHATNVLNFSQHGLAYLLNRYIDFVADKRYQLADWRIRPLPKEMLYYARSDTHTLVHVYDCLRFEIEKAEGVSGIETVFELSKKTAAKTYAIEDWSDDAEGREGWRSMWRKLAGEEALSTDARFEKEGVMGLTFTERLFRALHDWRDRVARSEDESARYILNSANLLNLASRAPESKEGVQACIGTGLKKRYAELVMLIDAEKKAFEKAKELQTDQQRALLEKAAAGVALEDEEIGDVVSIDDGQGASITLWPVEYDAGGESTALAEHLFRQSAPSIAAANKKRPSLFSPSAQGVFSQRLIQSIRSDIASSLANITGAGQHDVQGQQSQADDDDRPPPEQEIIPATEDVPAPNKDEIDIAAKKVTDGYVDVQDIVQARRKKEKKKARVSDPNTDGGSTAISESAKSKEGKKRKWTKEEKAERKRQLQEQREAVVPFDYNTVTSVLDKTVAEAKAGAKRTGKAGERKRKDGPTKSETTLQINPSRRGRYSDVGHGRDRKEQAGGKSMTFSQ